MRALQDLIRGLAGNATPNLSSTERWLSAGVGSAFCLHALRSKGLLRSLATCAVGTGLLYRGLSGHCQVYELLGVDSADKPETIKATPTKSRQTPDEVAERTTATAAVTINCSPDDLLAHWAILENWTQMFRHVRSVHYIHGNTARWSGKGLLGSTLNCDVGITVDPSQQTVSWQSVAGSERDLHGRVEFIGEPGESPTEVRLILDCDLATAHLLGTDLESGLQLDLEELKHTLEEHVESGARLLSGGLSAG